GFDISPRMVARAQANVERLGIDRSRIFVADIQDPISYAAVLPDAPFDGVMAMGVMPHVENDEMVLRNIAALTRPGGAVFIEFRNKLFSLFTFNRYTRDFILDDLLPDVHPELRGMVDRELSARVALDLPPARMRLANTDAPDYDAILA